MSNYDILILGGGSGGIACARRAVSHGRTTSIVALGPIGGTCVHAGCIPKKLNWEAAQAIEDSRWVQPPRPAALADSGGNPRVNLELLKQIRDAEIRRLQDVYERSLVESGINVIRGRAVVSRKQFVDVFDPAEAGRLITSLTADHVLVATGSEPIMPSNIPGVELCISSDEVWNMKKLPASMCIIGELLATGTSLSMLDV